MEEGEGFARLMMKADQGVHCGWIACHPLSGVNCIYCCIEDCFSGTRGKAWKIVMAYLSLTRETSRIYAFKGGSHDTYDIFVNICRVHINNTPEFCNI